MPNISKSIRNRKIVSSNKDVSICHLHNFVEICGFLKEISWFFNIHIDIWCVYLNVEKSWNFFEKTNPKSTVRRLLKSARNRRNKTLWLGMLPSSPHSIDIVAVRFIRTARKPTAPQAIRRPQFSGASVGVRLSFSSERAEKSLFCVRLIRRVVRCVERFSLSRVELVPLRSSAEGN